MIGLVNRMWRLINMKWAVTSEKVEALIAGFANAIRRPRRQVTYDLTQALIGTPRPANRSVPAGRRPTRGCRRQGLTTLIGHYTAVSLTLVAYNVRAGAVGLKR